MKDPYRRTSKYYDSFVERPNAILRKIALAMVPPEEGMTVLEVGCGTGTNLLLYENAGCQVFGIDLSQSMLDVARAKLSDHAGLRLGTAADMPYEDASFDLVIAFLTLHEMPRETRLAVMGEMVRVVRPDGRMLLVDYHPGPIRFPKGWFFKSVIVALEIAAGFEHHRNYRDFLARGGLQTMVATHGLAEETRRILSAGNILACVVR